MKSLLLVPLILALTPGVQTPAGHDGVIAGIVVSDSGAPVDRALVGLSGEGLHGGRTVISDDNGRFAFDRLPAGRFALAGSRVGFMSVEFGEDASGFGTRIRLTERQRVTNLRLRMTRGASIAGVVSDPRGGRLHGGNMQVTATPVTSMRQSSCLCSALIDFAGRFRIDGLSAGSYVVQAEFERRSTAVTVTVGVGEHRTGVNLSLTETESTLTGSRVDGRVSDADGRPVDSSVYLFSVATRAQPGIQGNPVPTPDVNGRVVYPAVAAGEYVAVASARDRGMYAASDLAIDGHSPASFALTLRPGSSVSGRIVFQTGRLKPPSDLSTVEVIFKPADVMAEMASSGSETYQTSRDGVFTTSGIPPGRYIVDLWSEGKLLEGWHVESAVLDGTNAGLALLTLSAGRDLSGLEIHVTDRHFRLEGTLQAPDNRPTPQGTVVMYPVDQRAWTREACQIRVVRPDTAGQFAIEDLLPGEYFIAAARVLERESWFDPKVLIGLGSSAVRVKLGDGALPSLTLHVR